MWGGSISKKPLLANGPGALSKQANNMAFLIADPYLATDPAKPDSFVVSGLGTPDPVTGLIADVTTPAVTNADGTVSLHLDLTPTVDGSYTVTVKAVLAGVESASSASATFTLPIVVPLTPGVPQNVRTSAT
jgi:hypothetical protein